MTAISSTVGENLESGDDKDREKKNKEIRERMNKSEIDEYVVKYMDWGVEEKPRVAQTSPPAVSEELQATVLPKPYRRQAGEMKMS